MKPALVASVMAVTFFACVERHYDGKVNARFRGHVSTASGSPVQAAVHLRDERLSNPSSVFICRTSGSGECTGTATYRFSYDERYWPWERAPKSTRRSDDRFTLIVTVAGYDTIQAPLQLSREQVEGVATVVFSIELPPR